MSILSFVIFLLMDSFILTTGQAIKIHCTPLQPDRSLKNAREFSDLS